MIDPSFLDELKELNFMLKKRVSSAYSGGRPSVKHGKGIEVVDYREYFPGDDFRLIDWRVYGRTEKLYIRRFEEERNLVLHIMVDCSSSMDFKTIAMSKFDYAGSLAVGFGFLAVNHHEKFATALYSNRLKFVQQPKKGRKTLFDTINLMNNMKLEGETRFGECSGQYSKMIKSKAFSVVISDFLEPIESIKEGIYRMAKHSKELFVIQVLDPWEVDLGWRNDIEFEDIETGDRKRSFLSPSFKRDYNRNLREHIASIHETCDDVGVNFVSVTTNVPLIDTFVNLVGGGRRHG
ncbi:MAG: DUF58 domain-containing protein [Candidatus Altiarchaeota archaeon]